MKSQINTDHLETQVLGTLVPGLGMIRHLKVQRRDGKSGISWDELQAVKNEALGPDVVAIEVYPKDEDVADELAMRHLWEMPDGVPIPNLSRRYCSIR